MLVRWKIINIFLIKKFKNENNCFNFDTGNSQGLKNKNLLKFKKTTLLGNSIKQAFRSKYIQRVVVSDIKK